MMSTVVPQQPRGIGSRTSSDIKIQGCFSPLYKNGIEQCICWPSASMDSQLWIENTVSDLRLVESRSTDKEG